MVTLKSRDVINSLEKKGFLRREGSHTFLILQVNGKKTSIHTMVSHGSKDIDDHLINKMSMQVKLEKNKFIDLATCPLSTDDYLKALKDQGYCFV
jgi:predicted RNA binding protein YcfA (HicA-like mRNA interferase family)